MMHTKNLQTIDSNKLDNVFWKCHNILRDNEKLTPVEAFRELIAIVLVYKFWWYELEHERSVKARFFNKKLNSLYSSILNTMPHIRLENSLPYIRIREDVLKLIIKVLNSHKHMIVNNEIFGIALNSFIEKDVRKSLGIYPTPKVVVDFVMELLELQDDSVVLDPAVGTGIFLMEALKKNRNIKVIGIDVDPLFLLLSFLNVKPYVGKEEQTLFILGDYLDTDNDSLDSVTHIFTNPPYGLKVDKGKYPGFLSFKLCKKDRLPAELLFLEKMILGSPEKTTFAILLPNSVLTNKSFETYRNYFNSYIDIIGMITFPAEIFERDEITQETALVFFSKGNKMDLPKFKMTCKSINRISVKEVVAKIKKGESVHSQNYNLEIVENITFDNNFSLNVLVEKETVLISEVAQIYKNPSINKNKYIKHNGSEIIEVVGEQNLYSKFSYVVKVGNLQDFYPDLSDFSNHLIKKEAKKKLLSAEENDILLTATAHQKRYIAKKVNIILKKPENFFELIPSPELLIIRPKQGIIHPVVLYAYLLLPEVKEQIQTFCRGSTAHLYPDDLLKNFSVPKKLLRISEKYNQYEDFKRLEGLINMEASVSIKKAQEIKLLLQRFKNFFY